VANINKVRGFRPVRYLSGANWSGKVSRYVTDGATALFVGDLVKLTTTGTSDGLRTIAQAAASDAVIGVVVGFEPNFADLNAAPYRLASTTRVAMVVDDPNVLFEAQEDGDTDPLEQADIGLNVNFVVGSGSTTTGLSGMQIDSDTHGTSATLPLKLMEVSQRVDNEFPSGGTAYTCWFVKINNHQLGSSTGTAGV
jgi:hypothetical protein